MALVFEKKKKRKHRIEWRDGAILLFEFPLIQDLIKENETFRGYVKAINDKKDKKELPEEEKKVAMDEEAFGVDYYQQSFKGWEGIIDKETGKPLPTTTEYRKQVLNDVMLDLEVMAKINIAMGGPLGNWKPGTTASTNTVGTSGHADDAREVKKKKAS